MEVLLAIDQSVVKFHGKANYKSYILAMVDIMNMTYNHESLGVHINVVLVQLVVFDDERANYLLRGNNIKSSLRRFCWWSSRVMRSSRTKRHKHDVAVYLTRTAIGPAGYAPISGMCRPHRSCAIIHDEGLSSAFVMAHEVAHIFGLQHNGHRNYCNGPQYSTTIMSAIVKSNYHNYSWSPCSKMHMQRVLPYLTCFNDEPLNLNWSALPKPLGSQWSMKEQCRQEFGEGYEVCRVIKPPVLCERLWCSQNTDSLLCKTKKGPPLDGTQCGHGMRCVQGRCKYESGVRPVDGAWSAWSHWGQCSTRCNRGVMLRTRKCDNPKPLYGGSSCVGGGVSYISCNEDLPCEKLQDLRAEQCNKLGGGLTHGTVWRPYQPTQPKYQCVVTCIREDTYKVIVTDTPVTNGAPCRYEDPDSMCVQSRCAEHRCDGSLNSTLRRDSCGICGGDNSDCHLVKGTRITSKHQASGSYEAVVKLPVGARNVFISETAATPQTLTIYDAAIGRHYQNSGPSGSSQQIVIGGARFVYRRQGHAEHITSSGPLGAPVLIQVYIADPRWTTSVSYQFYMIKEPRDTVTPPHRLTYTSGLLSASATEAAPVKEKDERSLDVITNHPTQSTSHQRETTEPQAEHNLQSLFLPLHNKSTISTQSVSTVEQKSTRSTLPDFEMRLNHSTTEMKPKNMNLTVQKLGERSTSHSKLPQHTSVQSFSTKSSIIPTTQQQNARTSTNINVMLMPTTVPQRNTPTRLETVVPKQDNEHIDSHTHAGIQGTEFVFRGWTQCSVTCGPGLQKAIYRCMDSDTREVLTNDACSHPPTHNTSLDLLSCNLGPCLSYRWYAGKWGNCSCGKRPQRQRSIKCRRIDSENVRIKGVIVEAELCRASDQPHQTQPCLDSQPCVGKWRLTRWSKCSVTCGEGNQSRRVICPYRYPNSCTSRTPTTTRTCYRPKCKAVKECIKDSSQFCVWATNERNCNHNSYRKMCCVSCNNLDILM